MNNALSTLGREEFEATQQQQDEIEQRVVCTLRTAKVTKGGREFNFTVIMVAGDRKGRLGIGVGKAREVPQAAEKASQNARRDMMQFALKGNTLQHEIIYSCGATKIFMKPASEGTGIIAGSSMRAIFEVMGVDNVLAKCIGSKNQVNVVRTTIKALKTMCTPAMVAAKRGKKESEIKEAME